MFLEVWDLGVVNESDLMTVARKESWSTKNWSPSRASFRNGKLA